MSKKFKSQASSARAASAAFGSSSFAFGSPSAAVSFQTASSSISYVTEQPDLSAVADPNVVVSLRNLGKKDNTTKGRALEELQEYVSSLASAEALDPGLLEAWVSQFRSVHPSCGLTVLGRSACTLAPLSTMLGESDNSHIPSKAPSLPSPANELSLIFQK